MGTKGFLGIDAGTQGLSAVFCDEELRVLATGEGTYGMIQGLAEGCYEQSPEDWVAALRQAMRELHANLSTEHQEIEVLSIGISGQMHGEVLADEHGNSLGPARLWCDSRNEAEANELTKRFDVKMPKRITAARWLWTLRNQPGKAQAVRRITTPAGWIAFRLTGRWNLGIGDAAGMFPVDQTTLNYRQDLLSSFDELIADDRIEPLKSLLPDIRRAGEEAGALTSDGAELLSLEKGIPVAAAEGDQPASLAGSLIGQPGMVSVSFGTSVCANSVGDRTFKGVSPAVDHFCAPDGKPINMVWLRNGTTYMNCLVKMFGDAIGQYGSDGFDAVMPKLIESPPDCDGLLALPFMDDEPGLGVSRGGTAMIVGLNPANASAGNVVKAALLSTMFNLRLGSEVLHRQGFPRLEIVLSGGLTKTPELAQVLADVFHTPVTMLESAEEGCAWGAALLAKFRHAVNEGSDDTWTDFLSSQPDSGRRRFAPNEHDAEQYDKVYDRYKRLMEIQPHVARMPRE